MAQGGGPHGLGNPRRDPRRKLAVRYQFCPSPAAVRLPWSGGYCVRVGVFKGQPAPGWGPTRGAREGRGRGGWCSGGGLGAVGIPPGLGGWGREGRGAVQGRGRSPAVSLWGSLRVRGAAISEIGPLFIM